METSPSPILTITHPHSSSFTHPCQTRTRLTIKNMPSSFSIVTISNSDRMSLLSEFATSASQSHGASTQDSRSQTQQPEQESLSEQDEAAKKKAVDEAADTVDEMRRLQGNKSRIDPGTYRTALGGRQQQLLRTILRIALLVDLEQDEALLNKLGDFMKAAGCEDKERDTRVGWLKTCKRRQPGEVERVVFSETTLALISKDEEED